MHKSKRLIILYLLFVLTQPSFGQVNKDSLDVLVKNLGQDLMKEKQSVGLSIGVYNNGKTYFYNFGTTEKGKQLIPTENTGYEIGSITKTFMSFLLAKAVSEKKVSLNDDIRKYLDGEYPNLEYSKNPVRLIHLANTSSGLPDWLPSLPDKIKKASSDSSSLLRADFFKKTTKQDFFNALHNCKLDTIPGSYGKHSNAAAMLLGYILETVFKKPISQLLQEYIATPLKMNGTSFSSTQNLAKGYNSKGDAMPYELPFFNTTGGLFSTTSDLLKYSKTLLDNQTEITKIVLQRTIEVDMQNSKVKKITSSNRYNPSAYCVSLNWFSYKFGNGITQIWADGGTSGFCSYLVLLPKLKSAIVLLANVNDEKIFKTLPNMTYPIMEVLGHK
jgi:serine-type D-Ala-D-Ala carboxypeptidase/endopeptidase